MCGTSVLISNDLVSIIMLSHNDEKFIADSVKSVQTQTYQNWELIFLDDSSQDDTLSQILNLRGNDERIKVSQSVFHRGKGISRISALREAQGRWITFLNSDDIWEPTKLEKQIHFMEENRCGFSYTKHRLIDVESKDMGYEALGPSIVNYNDMLQCCWPDALTVMYDANKARRVQLQFINENNEYALFLQISKYLDCLLLDECLAKSRVRNNWYNLMTWRDKLAWRYEVYRQVEKMNPFSAVYRTIVNLIYTIIKKIKYVKKVG